MPDRTDIDAAIEQVVKTSGDEQALEESVRELAGLLGIEVVAGDNLPLIVHGSFGGSTRTVGGDTAYVAPCGSYSPLMTMTGLFAAINCPGCLDALRDGSGGYEADAIPQPRDGDHGTCAECGAAIEYFGCPDAPYWRHVTHPTYCHDAELGGPA